MKKSDRIDALVALVTDWDLWTLLDYVKAAERARLSKMSAKEVQKEYEDLLEKKED